MSYSSCSKAFEAHQKKSNGGEQAQMSSVPSEIVCETGVKYACTVAGYSDPLYACLRSTGADETATVYSSMRGKACGTRLSSES